MLKRWFLKNMGGIPVRLKKFNREFFTETETILNDNKLILIFPEGKINTDKILEEFNIGFVKLAHRYNVPIIPITIRGTEKSLNKFHKFLKPANVTVTISHPIKYESEKFNKDEIQIEGEKIREIIQSH
jgi:1-acyl-sn-glycerol-3-phosphate acyltransferase